MKYLNPSTFIMAGIILFCGYYFTLRNHMVSDTGKMKEAIEEKFDCNLSKRYESNITFTTWHQEIIFTVSEDSKNKPSDEEVSEFLAANFPEFQNVDEFVLRIE
jgi:hypothetical protein